MRTPVSDLIVRAPLELDPGATLAEATHRMDELDVTCLPVVEQQPLARRLVGLLSERDVLRRPADEHARTRVGEVMSREPFVVRADTPAALVARTLVERRLPAAVVLEAGAVIGVFTARDALRALAEREEGRPPAPRPTWPRHILCPIDFSDGSREAVRMALELARPSGATVTIFHAFSPPVVAFGEAALAGASSIERMNREIEAELRAWKDTHERPGGPRITTAQGLGGAADAVTRYGQEAGIDLIVLGTHGRTGVKRVVLGSVAEHVVRHAHCPVLVVRRPS